MLLKLVGSFYFKLYLDKVEKLGNKTGILFS